MTQHKPRYQRFDIRSLLQLKRHEKTEAVCTIIEDSSLRPEFVVMNAIAVLVAVLWILEDSIPIITASMIIAPLIFPIIWFSLWVVVRNWKLVVLSARNLAINTVLVLWIWSISTLLISLFTDFSQEWYLANEVILPVTWLIGLVWWVAAAFMLSHKRLSQMMAWVAIAVALIPPLAVSTIHLSLGQRAELLQSLATYGTTLVTIALWAWSVFYLMNFEESEKEVAEEVEKSEEG